MFSQVSIENFNNFIDDMIIIDVPIGVSAAWENMSNWDILLLLEDVMERFHNLLFMALDKAMSDHLFIMLKQQMMHYSLVTLKLSNSWFGS